MTGRSFPAWQKQQVSPNDTRIISFTNLDFKNWPLPMNCFFSLDYFIGQKHSGNGSAYFVLNNQDPNYSAQTFSLTKTAASTPSIATTSTSSVDLTTPASPIITVAANSPTVVPSGASSGTPKAQSNGLDKGAKAGVVVACVGAFAGISLFLIIFSCLRRKKRQRQQDATPSVISIQGSSESSQTFSKPELSADQHPPQEMALVTNPSYSLAPYELSSTRDVHEMPTTPRLRR